MRLCMSSCAWGMGLLIQLGLCRSRAVQGVFMCTERVAAALLRLQVDREEREWCAGLPTHVFAPWVERLVAQDAPGITAPPLPVK